MAELFLQIGFLIIIASAVALILNLIRVPPVISYIIAGAVAGYFGLKPKSHEIDIMIEMGIILLLFLAGLEIKLRGFFELGKKTVLIGEGHDLIMALAGFGLAYFVFQLPFLPAMYLAIGITLSSTIVVVKALTSRKELSTPHGKVLIGTMILQDIVAMLSLAIFSSLGTQSTLYSSIVLMFAKGIFIFAVLYILGKFVLPKIFYYAAQQLELVFLVALGWLFGGVALSLFMDFSPTIGAFLAALAIADLPFSFEITDKIRGLRDFGILIFFLSVGFSLNITMDLFTNWQFYTLIAFVLFFTPLITSIIAGALAFTKKEIFLLSMLPTQVSEFTLILMTFGFSVGHISSELYTMITMVIVVTIMVSSWTIQNLTKIYRKIQHKLDFLEWRHVQKAEHLQKNLKGHIVIFGFGRLGQFIADFYKKRGKDILVVDWRPESIHIAKEKGCMHLFGDAGDSDLWEEVNLHRAALVISTIGKNQRDDIDMAEWLWKRNKKIIDIYEANDPCEADELYQKGADIVLVHDDLEWNDLVKYLEKPNKKNKKVFQANCEKKSKK